ncbi:MAG: hypothetical protein M3P50_11520 [Actinomycetota bacterium]|nr:hypothetical protein [Actinomycetota bacterium]
MRSIDLHTHVLPAVDDGPATLEGSLELARAAEAAGTAVLAATPHVNDSRFIEPAAIPGAVDELNGHLHAAGIGVEVVAGGEIALPRVLDLSEAELAGLGLGGGPWVLLESPFAAVGAFEALILEVHARGHPVLLAHPERCAAFQRDPARLERLVESGVRLQVTAGALTGAFGSKVREFSLRLLRGGLVHVIASDAHDAIRRPPGIAAAIEAAERAIPGVAARGPWLTEAVPAAMLAGQPLPEPPPLVEQPRSGRWRRRLGAVGRR